VRPRPALPRTVLLRPQKPLPARPPARAPDREVGQRPTAEAGGGHGGLEPRADHQWRPPFPLGRPRCARQSTQPPTPAVPLACDRWPASPGSCRRRPKTRRAGGRARRGPARLQPPGPRERAPVAAAQRSAERYETSVSHVFGACTRAASGSSSFTIGTRSGKPELMLDVRRPARPVVRTDRAHQRPLNLPARLGPRPPHNPSARVSQQLTRASNGRPGGPAAAAAGRLVSLTSRPWSCSWGRTRHGRAWPRWNRRVPHWRRPYRAGRVPTADRLAFPDPRCPHPVAARPACALGREHHPGLGADRPAEQITRADAHGPCTPSRGRPGTGARLTTTWPPAEHRTPA